MAKIVITLDTETKELFATIDGAPVPEISGISASKYEDYNDKNQTHVSCELELKPIESEDSSYTINTHICAYANLDGVKILKNISQKQVNASVANWLK